MKEMKHMGQNQETSQKVSTRLGAAWKLQVRKMAISLKVILKFLTVQQEGYCHYLS
jgi:hypothetical protein